MEPIQITTEEVIAAYQKRIGESESELVVQRLVNEKQQQRMMELEEEISGYKSAEADRVRTAAAARGEASPATPERMPLTPGSRNGSGGSGNNRKG